MGVKRKISCIKNISYLGFKLNLSVFDLFIKSLLFIAYQRLVRRELG